jgi:hypothetical protein
VNPAPYGLQFLTAAIRDPGVYFSPAVEVFKNETREIIRRFLAHRLTFAGCIASLDEAFSDVSSRASADQIESLRAITLANNELVMIEMERRTARTRRKSSVQ